MPKKNLNSNARIPNCFIPLFIGTIGLVTLGSARPAVASWPHYEGLSRSEIEYCVKRYTNNRGYLVVPTGDSGTARAYDWSTGLEVAAVDYYYNEPYQTLSLSLRSYAWAVGVWPGTVEQFANEMVQRCGGW